MSVHDYIERRRKLAREAAPGPWERWIEGTENNGLTFVTLGKDGGDIGIGTHPDHGGPDTENADHIAASDPTNTQREMDVIEAAAHLQASAVVHDAPEGPFVTVDLGCFEAYCTALDALTEDADG